MNLKKFHKKTRADFPDLRGGYSVERWFYLLMENKGSSSLCEGGFGEYSGDLCAEPDRGGSSHPTVFSVPFSAGEKFPDGNVSENYRENAEMHSWDSWRHFAGAGSLVSGHESG